MTDSASANHLCLSARLVECEPLRFTPAGMAICQGRLEHESTQIDAGHDRQVHFTIAARFAGALAEQIATKSLGCSLQLTGFIAAKRVFRDGTSSASLVMHVMAFESE